MGWDAPRPAGCSKVNADGMLEASRMLEADVAGMLEASRMLRGGCGSDARGQRDAPGWLDAAKVVPPPAEARLACSRPPPCMSGSSLCPQPPPAPKPGRIQRASRTRGVRARRNAPHNKHTVTPGPACVCPQPPSVQLWLVSSARGSRSGQHPAAPLSLHKPQ